MDLRSCDVELTPAWPRGQCSDGSLGEGRGRDGGGVGVAVRWE